MNEETRAKILEDMTTERDLRNQFDYACRTGYADGRNDGRAEGQAETVCKMLAAGVPVETIANALGISVEECQSL